MLGILVSIAAALAFTPVELAGLRRHDRRLNAWRALRDYAGFLWLFFLSLGDLIPTGTPLGVCAVGATAALRWGFAALFVVSLVTGRISWLPGNE